MFSSFHRRAASWAAALFLLASSPVAGSILDQSVIKFDEKCPEQNVTMWAADGRNFVMRRGGVALHWPKEHNATTWILEKAGSQYPSSWYIAGLLPDGARAYWYTGGNDAIQLQQSQYSRTAFTIKIAETNDTRPRVAIYTTSIGTASYLNYEPDDGRVYVSYTTEPDNVLFEPVARPNWTSTDAVCDGLVTEPPKEGDKANRATLDLSHGEDVVGAGTDGVCQAWSDCAWGRCGFYERCCLKANRARREDWGFCECGTSGRQDVCW